MNERDEVPIVIANLGGVRLRTWLPSDVSWYADLVDDPRVMRFIVDGSTRDHAQAEREIAGFREEQKLRGWSRWIGECEINDAPIGFIGFSFRNGQVDWGGRAFPRYWGSSSLFIAYIAALEEGIVAREIKEAVAVTDLKNDRAWRVNLRLGWSEPILISRYGRDHVKQTINRNRFMEDGQASKNRALAARLIARNQKRGSI